MTLGTIIEQIRNRCDLNNSEFITNDEITNYVNFSLGELYGLLVNSFGGDYFATSVVKNIAANGTALSTNLPNDLYKVLGIDLQISPSPSTNRITLQPYNFNERNRANSSNMSGYATQYCTNYRYRLFNQTLQIQPPAAGALELLVWYVPVAPQFDTTDPLDLAQTFENNSNLNNWLEYVIVDVSIKCKAKEETDPALFVRAKALLTERIRNESQNRDIGSPPVVSDVYATGAVTDLGFGSNGFGWTA
jgi:hypothetical protein